MMGRKPKLRILIVEDQKDIRKVLTKQLEGAGHSVFACENGEAALHILDADDFELIVTDIVMPGAVQGPDLAKWQCRRRPSQKFIFLSGFSDQFSWSEHSSLAHFPRLTKPIFRADLLAAVEGLPI